MTLGSLVLAKGKSDADERIRVALPKLLVQEGVVRYIFTVRNPECPCPRIDLVIPILYD